MSARHSDPSHGDQPRTHLDEIADLLLAVLDADSEESAESECEEPRRMTAERR
jgi:hypothetical protein